MLQLALMILDCELEGTPWFTLLRAGDRPQPEIRQRQAEREASAVFLQRPLLTRRNATLVPAALVPRITNSPITHIRDKKLAVLARTQPVTLT